MSPAKDPESSARYSAAIARSEIQNKGPATPPTTAATKANRGCVRSGEDQATQAEGEGSDRGNSRPRSRIGQKAGKRSHEYRHHKLGRYKPSDRRGAESEHCACPQRDEEVEQFDRPVQERRRCPYRPATRGTR